ncbi:MAG TPA: glutamyl-tRNA reductase [candidate division Zixibacteria bacterium]|nr:glutamyl-tRNA reductase [candidate division Zixibacteria bacterium]
MTEWRLVLCGINHKTSTVEQREPLQIGPEDAAEALEKFGLIDGVVEAVIISTCNRVEFCFVGPRKRDPFDLLCQFYQEYRGIDIARLEECFYQRKGKHVARHLFRVCAGIDSMVLGENQIFGQVKEAYSSSCRVKMTGKILHRVFHQAFRVGKQVRTDTEMGRGACSVSSAAIELLRSGLDLSTRPTVLFIGVNRMISLAASSWRKLHHKKLVFANRTPEKAIDLAAKFKGSGHGLDELPALLREADIVFTSTGSEQPIVTRKMLNDLFTDMPDKQLTVMDIAIPRDVEVSGEFHPGLKLLDMEDVQAFVDQRQSERAAAIPNAEAIIAERLQEFAYWYDHIKHEFTYDSLSEKFEAIKDQELAPIFNLLPSQYHRAVREAAERMAHKMAQVKYRVSEQGENGKKGRS